MKKIGIGNGLVVISVITMMKTILMKKTNLMIIVMILITMLMKCFVFLGRTEDSARCGLTFVCLCERSD